MINMELNKENAFLMSGKKNQKYDLNETLVRINSFNVKEYKSFMNSDTKEVNEKISIENGCNQNVIYFSDGKIILDENGDEKINGENLYTKHNLIENSNWKLSLNINVPVLNFALNLSSKFGNKVLYTIDYIGSTLSSFLGITDLKYAYELDYAEYEKKIRQEIEEEDNDDVTKWTF